MNTHNHGAAVSGAKSEKVFKTILESYGFPVLRKKDEFRKFYGERLAFSKMKESIYLQIPDSWKDDTFKTKLGKEPKFYVDYYQPDFDLRIELKYSKARGTTEEKIFFDLEKIRDNVYGDKKLLYVFFGPLANKQRLFRLFSKKVKQFDPSEEKVKVIFDDSEDLQVVKNYFQTLKRSSI